MTNRPEADAIGWCPPGRSMIDRRRKPTRHWPPRHARPRHRRGRDGRGRRSCGAARRGPDAPRHAADKSCNSAISTRVRHAKLWSAPSGAAAAGAALGRPLGCILAWPPIKREPPPTQGQPKAPFGGSSAPRRAHYLVRGMMAIERPKDSPVIILCGGQGTRIADVSAGAIPKPLVPTATSTICGTS